MAHNGYNTVATLPSTEGPQDGEYVHRVELQDGPRTAPQRGRAINQEATSGAGDLAVRVAASHDTIGLRTHQVRPHPQARSLDGGLIEQARTPLRTVSSSSHYIRGLKRGTDSVLAMHSSYSLLTTAA